MSVTVCPDCQEYLDSPCDCDGDCGYCTDGVMVGSVPKYIELNMANVTARIMFNRLGLDDESLMGSIAIDGIPSVRRKIFKLLNRDRSSMIRVPISSTRVIDGGVGTNDEYWRSRLVSFDRVMEIAQSNGVGISWA